jgi:hypothetical protein
MTNFFEGRAFRQGLSFGIVSSAMTVLGISLGMWSSNQGIKAIIASIIGLSISNALADGFSMYMSNKAIQKDTHDKNIAFKSAATTSFVEFILPFIFLLPFLLYKQKTAILLNTILGVILVGGMGIYVSKLNHRSDEETVMDTATYISITFLIMGLTYLSGLITKYI